MRASPPSARVERERTEQRPQFVCVPRLVYHATASAVAASYACAAAASDAPPLKPLKLPP